MFSAYNVVTTRWIRLHVLYVLRHSKTLISFDPL